MTTPINTKEALAKGAAEIKKAKADSKKPATKATPKKQSENKAAPKDSTPNHVEEPNLLAKTFKPSTRPIQEIVSECITIKSNIGLTVKKNTSLEDQIAVLHFYADSAECAAFYIGDLILAGQAQHGAKYEAALAVTGRPLATLKTYVNAARNIPIAIRQPTKILDYSVQREVARMKDKEKAGKILEKAAEDAKKGAAPTVKEIRVAVVKAEPPTVSKPKKPKAAGATKGTNKPAEPAHEYTHNEQEIYNDLLSIFQEADDILTKPEGKAFVEVTIKTPAASKRVLSAPLASIVKFANLVEKYTGY